MGSGVSKQKKEKDIQQQQQVNLNTTQSVHNNINNNNNNSNNNSNNITTNNNHSNVSSTRIEPLVVSSPRLSARNSQSESHYSRASRSPGQAHEFNNNNNNNNDDNEENNNGNDDENEENEQSLPDEQEEENMRMHFAQSAMSLGMDNDDLIFNLLYFGDAATSFQSMFNTAIEETVAAHSADNTPYKLHPASNEALGSLKIVIMTNDTKLDQNECSICQEDLEPGQEIIFMPDCNHSFHNECALRWFRLQSWCPICRTEILSHENSTSSNLNDGKHRKVSNNWKSNLNTAFEESDMEYNENGGNEVDGEDNDENYDEDNDDKIQDYTYKNYSYSKYQYENENESNDGDDDDIDNDNYNDDDIEYHSDLKQVRSMESMMAKQTIDNVMENILTPNKR